MSCFPKPAQHLDCADRTGKGEVQLAGTAAQNLQFCCASLLSASSIKQSLLQRSSQTVRGNPWMKGER